MVKNIQNRTGSDIVDGSFDTFAPLASQSLFWPLRYAANSPALGAVALLFWLTENLRPSIAVTLGLEDAVPHFALCQAIDKLNLEALCFGLETPHKPLVDASDIMAYNDRYYADFSSVIEGDHTKTGNIFEGSEIDLLIVNHPATQAYQDEIEASWLPKMSDSAAILFLRGGDNIKNYVAHISDGRGYFTLDMQEGIHLALRGKQHNERMMRLCKLRPGRPGYLAARSVFMRIGELHVKTQQLTDLKQERSGGHKLHEQAQKAVKALNARSKERHDIHEAQVRVLTTERDAAYQEAMQAHSTLAEVTANAKNNHASVENDLKAREQEIMTLYEEGQLIRSDLSSAQDQNAERVEDIIVLGQELFAQDMRLKEAQTLTKSHAKDLARLTQEQLSNSKDIVVANAKIAEQTINLTQITTRLKSVETMLENERLQVVELKRQNTVLLNNAKGKERTITELRARITLLRGVQAQCDEALQRVKDLEHSTSWRMTSPFRKASLMMKPKK